MKTLFNNYLNTFKGLSREVWWLALITLINRAGTMVVPFLSLYLTKNLNFTISDVGWIMSAFGLGAFVGSWLGGVLTDKIGYYKVMVFSLVMSGVIFIFIQYLTSFYEVVLGIFILLTVADMFRPAMYVAVSAYSKPENKTRSITLIRLAINLGFSVGPALGGLIIINMSYGGLFWADGITCIMAGLLLLKVLHPKKSKTLDNIINDNPISVYKDIPYLVFLIAMVLFSIAFLQYFSTMPLYYKEVHFLSEDKIGMLLALNGVLIVIIEMPFVKWLEKTRYTMLGLILFGAILTGLSFVVLNLTSWIGVLLIGMILMTVGEIIAFPFSNAFSLKRAKRGKQGEYMALYTMAFALANIIGHNLGLQLIDALGFESTWNIIIIVMMACIITLVIVKKQLRKEIL